MNKRPVTMRFFALTPSKIYAWPKMNIFSRWSYILGIAISFLAYAELTVSAGAQTANLNGCDTYSIATSSITVTCNSGYAASTSGVQTPQSDTTVNNTTVNIESSASRSINGSTVGIGSGSTVTNAGKLNTQSFFYGYGVSFGANGRSQAGGNTFLNTSSGTITTGGTNAHGVYISSTNASAAASSITNNGTISVTGRGANAININSPTALVTITNGASATASSAQGSAIYVTGNSSVTNSGNLRGAGTSSETAVISVSGTPSRTITNQSGGVIEAYGSTFNPAALAIVSRSPASDGGITINNAGTITGRVILSDNSEAFTNSGTWNTSGTSQFNIGADTLTNTSTGRINAYGSTTFDMGGQTPVHQNTFDNQGYLKVSNGTDGSAGVLNVFSTGNETLKFNNSGIIDLGGDGIGKPKNQLIINGDLYVGDNSKIVIDTPTGGSTNNIVIDGNASGAKTDLILAPDTVGSNNPIGSAVVSIRGEDTSGGIAISPSSPGFNYNNGTPIVNAGLYYYYLSNSTGTVSCAGGYKCYSLYSIASTASRTLPIAVTAAQNIWQETALMWEDRQVELRDTARISVKNNDKERNCNDANNGCGLSTWVKSVGSWSNRSNNQSYFGGNGSAFGYDLGYRQNIFGMLGGADWSKTNFLSSEDYFAVGVMGGYLQSSVGFNQEAGNLYGSSSFSYQGGTVGGSVTYMKNGFFVDAMMKTDLVGLNMTLPIGAMRNASMGSRTAGAIGNLGYRLDYASLFIEPLATLTYSKTGMGSIDKLAYQNVSISFGNGEDFRGGFGGRIGKAWSNFIPDHTLEASLTGRYWNMFNSNAGRSIDINSSGIGDTLGDYTLGRDYGEVKGNLNVYSFCSGWSAFVNTGTKWNNQFTTVTTKGGVAYRW
jgi:hypothetical protein